jgi:hypothetical protein
MLFEPICKPFLFSFGFPVNLKRSEENLKKHERDKEA